MSNTFSAQELADFYQKVADGGEIEFRVNSTASGWYHSCVSPSLDDVRQDWRIKSTKKIIDLSVLIDSQIDCEFKDDISERITIGKLLEITNDDNYPYTTGNSRADEYGQCQPRMNHKHTWLGGDCPLPEGFMVKVWLRDADYEEGRRLVSEIIWCHDNTLSDIIAFEVLGLSDGYVMPWEQQDND